MRCITQNLFIIIIIIVFKTTQPIKTPDAATASQREQWQEENERDTHSTIYLPNH